MLSFATPVCTAEKPPDKQGVKFVNADRQFFFLPERLSGRSGFTLVELVVIIVIMGIVSAMAIGGLSTLIPRHHVKSAAQQLRADLQKARLEAVKSNRDALVVFASGEFLACFDENGDDACTESDDTIIGQIDFTKKNFQHARLETGNVNFSNNRFRFNSRGIPDEAGTISIHLNNDTGYSYLIRLQRSGRIIIE